MRTRKRLALILSLVMPGLGHAFSGARMKGASLFIIFLATALIGFRGSVLLPGGLLLPGILLTIVGTLAVYAFAAVDAWRSAKRPESSHPWTLYLAAWLFGSVLIGGAVFGYARESVVEAFVIPSASMEPAVRVGDRVLADKTAYERLPPHKGDIVIFVNPDDRSQRYIKRITALPGEAVTLADGTTQAVPHGMVYVMGDNRKNSVDSRVFGFLPLRDVVAKVRQVYFSADSDGIRWERIGLSLESE